MVEVLKLTLVARRYSSASSGRVASGRSSTMARSARSPFLVTLLLRPPPCGEGSRAPVSRKRRTSLLTDARPTWNSSATWSLVRLPQSYAATIRFRRSTDSGSGIATSENGRSRSSDQGNGVPLSLAAGERA